VRADSHPLERCLQAVQARLPHDERRSLSWRGGPPLAFLLRGQDTGRVLAISISADGTWHVSLDGRIVRETPHLRVAADVAARAWLGISAG
jgi:hypothetical protein